MRRAITATLLSTMFALSAASETSPRPLPQRPRLADLVKQEVPNAPIPPVEPQNTISDYEILNDSSYFIVGFYTFHPETTEILPPLRILLLDKGSNSWKYLEIQGKSGANDDPKNWCLGSVFRIKPIAEKFFLETHVTPSASCQFVLSRSLHLDHILYGWRIESSLASRRLLIGGNSAHFAKTHPPSLSLYDPASAAETPLLPLAGDSSMKWLDDELGRLVDESWCAENNSPCEATGLSGELQASFVNDKSNAVALQVKYSGEGMGPRAENFKTVVIYVFDLSGKTLQHREFKSDELHKMIRNYDMEKLTQPSILRLLFSPSASR